VWESRSRVEHDVDCWRCKRRLGSTVVRLVTGSKWGFRSGLSWLMGESCDPMMCQPYLQVQVVVLGIR